MAGVYTHPAYQGAQPWRQPAQSPVDALRSGFELPRGRGWVQVVGAPIGNQLAGLGAAPAGASAPAYAAVSLLGATVGGMTVGFVAAGSAEGAVTGGLFSAGLAGLADAPLLLREGHTGVATFSGLVGLVALGTSLHRAFWA